MQIITSFTLRKLVLLGLTIAVVLSVLSVSRDDTLEVEPPVENIFGEYVVSASQMKDYVSLSGVLEPEETVYVSSKIPGRVNSVSVDVGDHVSAGDIMVYLDHSEVDASLSEAQASLDEARAGYQELQNTIESSIITKEAQVETLYKQVSAKEEDLAKQTHTTYVNGLQVGRSGVQTLINALITLSDIQLARPGNAAHYDEDALRSSQKRALQILLAVENGGLYNSTAIAKAKGGISQELTLFGAVDIETYEVLLGLLEEIESVVEEVNIGLTTIGSGVYSVYSETDVLRQRFVQEQLTIAGLRTSLRAQIELMRAVRISEDSTITSLMATIESIETELTQIKSDAAQRDVVGSSRIDSAIARKEGVEVTRNNAYIRASYSGVVGEKFVSPGAVIQPGEPLFSLLNVQTWKMAMHVPDVYNSRVHRGDEVSVIVDGLTGEYVGRISRISPELDRDSKKIVMEVRIGGLPLDARSGLFARIKLQVSSEDVVYTIPKKYLGYGYDGMYITTLAGVNMPVRIVGEEGQFVYVEANGSEETFSIVYPR